MSKEDYTQLPLDISVESDLIKKDVLEGRAESFVAWAERGRRNRNLNKIIGILKEAGQVTDDVEALDILESEVTQHFTNGSVGAPLRSSDFTGRGVTLNGSKRILRKYRESGDARDEDIGELVSLNLGSISHRGIVDVYRRSVGDVSWQDLAKVPDRALLFDQSSYSMYRPLEEHEYCHELGFGPDYVGEIDFLWHLHAGVLEENPSLFHSNEYRNEFLRLEELLAPLYGKHMFDAKKVAARTSDDSRYMYTLLTWANAAVDASRRPSQVIFSEVPVFHWAQNGIDGGRIDAIEILGLDGYELNSEEKRHLQDLSMESHSSAGHLLSRICDEMRCSRVDAKIVDYKFAVGDAPKRDALIAPDEIVDGPISRHAEQIRRYLTLSPVDFSTHVLDESQDLSEEDVWGVGDPFAQGEIRYFHPLQFPLSHVIHLNADEKRDLFETYRTQLTRAQERAQVRIVDGMVGRFVESAVNGKNVTGRAQKRINPRIETFLRDRNGKG